MNGIKAFVPGREGSLRVPIDALGIVGMSLWLIKFEMSCAQSEAIISGTPLRSHLSSLGCRSFGSQGL